MRNGSFCIGCTTTHKPECQAVAKCEWMGAVVLRVLLFPGAAKLSTVQGSCKRCVVASKCE